MTNIESFVQEAQKNRRRLYHFTDGRNVASIKLHGLLPTEELQLREIEAITGGNRVSLGLDQANGFDRYVRLSFCRSHPMAHVAVQRGSIQDVRKFSVCPSVLLRDGVRLSDAVAIANDAKIGTAEEMIEQIDWHATYKLQGWHIPENQARRYAAEKWEALIPSSIAPELILEI